ncbi:hypothetical protein N9F12_02140 [Burkholderiaceae bacterium]|nr:hypothetical protein [Burkholderiaceae bacterium]
MPLIANFFLVGVFAASYFSLFWGQVNVLGEFDFLPMASILFLPAGVKFIAMLVGRHWGVVGIALGKVLVDIYSGSVSDLSEQIPHLLVWLVAPYACMLIFLKQKDLSQTLDGLTTFDLVVLALIVSLVSSLGTQLYFFGMHEPGYPLLKGVWSMTLGDISGILFSLGAVIFIRRLLTSFADRQTNSTTLR